MDPVPGTVGEEVAAPMRAAQPWEDRHPSAPAGAAPAPGGSLAPIPLPSKGSGRKSPRPPL